MNEFKVGDKVKYIGNLHSKRPEWYPRKGTIGTIILVTKDVALVQWPKGSTSLNDDWHIISSDLKLIKETKMTRAKFEEIVVDVLDKCADAICTECKYNRADEAGDIHHCKARFIADELIKAHRTMKEGRDE